MKTNIFFDMDGVLCEYSYDYLNPRIYETLKPMLNRILLLNTLIDNGYSVFVLSSLPHCSDDIHSYVKAKEDYFNRYVPKLSRDKQLYVHREDKVDFVQSIESIDTANSLNILIDDYSTNLHRWDNGNYKYSGIFHSVKNLNGINGNSGFYRKWMDSVLFPDECYTKSLEKLNSIIEYYSGLK